MSTGARRRLCAGARADWPGAGTPGSGQQFARPRTQSVDGERDGAPRFQWPLIAAGIVAGSFEEIGWTGFVTPRLPARRRVFMSGVSLGLAWALWHLMVDFRQNFTTMGMVWPIEFTVFYLAALTAYRVLMTWLYANTRSLLLAVMMHASYTGWLLVLYPATSFQQGLIWQTAFAAALWLIVAVVMTRFVYRERADSPVSRTIEVRGPA